VRSIGVRREDENRWERRTPLTPDHVAELVSELGLAVRVEPSPLRAFPDEEYAAAGAEVTADLTPCPVILGVKETPRRRSCRERPISASPT
jgi:alpha-aminoadipic semialdehyde synthase